VADEPTLGELTRRLDGLTAMLAQLVSRAEYAADQRLAERRFTEVENDVADLRRQVTEELKALKTSIDAATEKRGTNVRQAVYAGLLPALFMMVSIVVQIWLAARGGS
jgi:hypothetical protein